MKKMIYLFLLSSITLFYGCKNMRLTEIERQEQEKQISKDLGYEFVESFATNNKAGFIELLSEEVKESFNESQFEHSYKNIIDKYGKIEDFEFICFLDNPVYNIQIWKLTFIKNNTANDLLFRILSIKDNEIEQEQITGFAFI